MKNPIASAQNSSRAQLVSSSINLFAICSFLVLAYLYQNASKEKKDSNYIDLSDLMVFMFTALGGQYLMSNLTTPAFNKFYKSLTPYLPEMLISDRDLVQLKKFELAISKLRQSPNIPAENIERLTELIDTFKRTISSDVSLGAIDASSTKATSKAIKYILQILNIYDQQSITLSTIDEKNRTFNKLDALLKPFCSATKEQLQHKVILPFIANATSNYKNFPIAPVLLVGPPGTGKTMTITEIAKIVNAPLIRLTKNDLNHDYACLESYADFETKKISVWARAAYEAVQQKTNMAVILIDEIDKFLSHEFNAQYLLELLGAQNYSDSYLNIELNFSRVLIALTANKKPSEIDPKYAPIDDRCTILEFKAFEKNQKEELLLTKATELYSAAGLQLKQQDNDEIKERVSNDNTPGLRPLMLWLANSVLLKQASNLVLPGTIWERKQNQQELTPQITNSQVPPNDQTGEPTKDVEHPAVRMA